MENWLTKKGVSPLIASIILIALVIAIGAIIFIWFQSMTQEAVTKFDGQNVEIVCEDVQFDASYSNGEVSIVNNGNVPIYNMNLQLEGSAGQSETTNATSVQGNWDAQTGLNQGGAATLTISQNYESITLIPVLMGLNDDGERKTKACEERHGEEIFP